MTSDTGTYFISVTNSFACKNTSVPVKISDFISPTVSINPVKNSTICQNSPIELNSKSSGSISSMQWSLNGMDLIGGTSDSILTTTTGKYVIKVTSTDGCVDSSDIQIIVNESPIAKFKQSKDSICSGSPVAFTNNSTISSGSLSSKWNFGNGDSSLFLEMATPRIQIVIALFTHTIRIVFILSPYQ